MVGIAAITDQFPFLLYDNLIYTDVNHSQESQFVT